KPKNKIPQTTITNYEVTNNSEQLEEIMTCLAKIQQQQEEILQDIALLKQLSPIMESKQRMLTAEQHFKPKKSSETHPNS
ncbi:MAG: hypothetical protein ACRC8K_01590, partial [Waterburya sp.]